MGWSVLPFQADTRRSAIVVRICVAFAQFPQELPDRATAIGRYVRENDLVDEDLKESDIADIVTKLDVVFNEHSGSHNARPPIPTSVWTPLRECTEPGCADETARRRLLMKSVGDRRLLSSCPEASDCVKYGTFGFACGEWSPTHSQGNVTNGQLHSEILVCALGVKECTRYGTLYDLNFAIPGSGGRVGETVWDLTALDELRYFASGGTHVQIVCHVAFMKHMDIMLYRAAKPFQSQADCYNLMFKGEKQSI